MSEKMYYLPQSLFEKPWIENSRTMVSIDCLQFLADVVYSDPHLPPLPCVPLRAFAEALGWEVHWNNETRAISLKNQVT